MLSLVSCDFAKCYTICQIKNDCPPSVRRRLFDLGFTDGQTIKKIQTSLLGKVILVQIRGYLLSIRSSIADSIMVKAND